MSGAVALAPDVSKWEAWSPDQVGDILASVDAPWYVAGGWAIDLFLGGQRREHGDLEIAVPASRFDQVTSALSAYELYAVGDGEASPLFEGGDAILETTHQTWVREPAVDRWRLDVFREPSDDTDWIFRRDGSIRLPHGRTIRRTVRQIPYGSPEVILLFKASAADEEKHADDFAAVLPLLGAERRRWLAAALAHVHPGHPWLDDLLGE